MITDLIYARIQKLDSLIAKYESLLSFSSIEPSRKIQVKAYIHCFHDELEFLQSLSEEPANQNADFDNDDDEF
jgi:hypothetical protein